MEGVLGILLVVMAFFLYFLPYFVAKKTKKQNAEAIGILNLLLGWTVVGWVAALVWATAKDANVQPTTNTVAAGVPKAESRPLALQQTPSQKKCPDCAELVLAEARKCRFCGHQFDAVMPGSKK